MKELLKEIQSGQFATELSGEMNAGMPTIKVERVRARAAAHRDSGQGVAGTYAGPWSIRLRERPVAHGCSSWHHSAFITESYDMHIPVSSDRDVDTELGVDEQVDEADDAGVEGPRRRGIYLLPNLFTTAGLFAGFYAIVAAIAGYFQPAAIAVFVAMIMDGLDGRIARLTHTESAFGKEYDSLSDMVSFGLAPALVMYEWAFKDMIDYGSVWGKVGWLGAFFYAITAALRLARFNVRTGVVDKRYFQGLPSPAAAGIVAGSVWLGVRYSVFPVRRWSFPPTCSRLRRVRLW